MRQHFIFSLVLLAIVFLGSFAQRSDAVTVGVPGTILGGNGPVLCSAIGAVTLGPKTVAVESVGTFSSPMINGDYLETTFAILHSEQAVIAGYNNATREFSARSSSPDFHATLVSMDSVEDSEFIELSPVPETSTWVAAFLAALLVMWQARWRFARLRFD